eukprot:TRINITY_DN3305_c0_g1_i2.p1 TRINITY_DN3305_c0_g1~~TRINITY_DN3305_c0_g1_i2.p1  ORF type:complete len:299 (+),score=28.25 TRINITY_DN3305_c0_g1_i2:108-899(+)
MKRVRVEGELGSGFILDEEAGAVDGGLGIPQNNVYRERVEYDSGEYEFPCIKLRGLPFECTEREICEFLAADPIDILMVRRGGRFSGEAFVLLDGSHLVETIIQCKNEQYMGRRYIEVFRAKKLDYYKAITNEILDEAPGLPLTAPVTSHVPVLPSGGVEGGMLLGHGTNVIRMRGLPYSVTAIDVAHWFNSGSVMLSTRISPDQVLVCTNRGRATGTGYVEFSNAQDANLAMRKNKHLMGSRYIELFVSDQEELQKAIRKNS